MVLWDSLFKSHCFTIKPQLEAHRYKLYISTPPRWGKVPEVVPHDSKLHCSRNSQHDLIIGLDGVLDHAIFSKKPLLRLTTSLSILGLARLALYYICCEIQTSGSLSCALSNKDIPPPPPLPTNVSFVLLTIKHPSSSPLLFLITLATHFITILLSSSLVLNLNIANSL